MVMTMFSMGIVKASTNETLAGRLINPPTGLSIIGSPIYSLRSTLIQNIWSGNGRNYSMDVNVINSAMHSLSVGQGLSTDYQITTIDLSGWRLQ